MSGRISRERYSYRDDPSVPAFPDDKPLIVFDGICVLCSASARFVMRHDPAGAFRLTAAQSPVRQALYGHYGLDPADYDTFLVLEGGRAFLKSEAALHVAAGLGWPRAAASIPRALPAALRDAAYDAVARTRYRVFGRRPTCFVARPDQAGRFV